MEIAISSDVRTSPANLRTGHPEDMLQAFPGQLFVKTLTINLNLKISGSLAGVEDS